MVCAGSCRQQADAWSPGNAPPSHCRWKAAVPYYDFTEDLLGPVSAIRARSGQPPSTTRSICAWRRAIRHDGFSIHKSVPIQAGIDTQPNSSFASRQSAESALVWSGTTPFIGDYIDLRPIPIYVVENGQWKLTLPPRLSGLSSVWDRQPRR